MNYVVQRKQMNEWISLCSYSFEDKEIFVSIANTPYYQYRILLDGEDVTKKYKK